MNKKPKAAKVPPVSPGKRAAVSKSAPAPTTGVGTPRSKKPSAAKKPAPHGSVVGIGCSAEEITGRKHAREGLRRNAALFAKIIEQAPGGVCVVDAQLRLQHANAAALALFASVQPVIGRAFDEVMGVLWGPETAALIMGIFRHTLATGERYVSTRFSEVRHDIGVAQAYTWETQRIILPDGRHGVVCWFNDVTEREHAAAALRASEERFRAVAENLGDGLVLTDLDDTILDVNPRLLAMSGYARDEMIGRKAYDVLNSPEQAEEIQVRNAERAEGRSGIYEILLRRKDGSRFWAEVTGAPLRDAQGRIFGTVGLLRDFTERKRAEKALRESQQFLRRITEVTPAVLHVFDLENQRAVFVSQAVASVIGYSAEEVAAMGNEVIPTLMHPDDVSRFAEHMRRVRTLGDHEHADFEHRMRAKSGEWRWFQNHDAVFSRDSEGKVGQIIGAATDITGRKRAEEALRASEQEFRTLAEVVPQIVWATRPDGWNNYFNQQWVDYTGLTLEESYGHGWITPFHPDDKQRAWDAWQRAIQHNETYSLECRLRRADGVHRWWLIRGVPVRGADGEILKWFGTCTDIQDLKQAEEEVHRLNRELEARVLERTEALSTAVVALRAEIADRKRAEASAHDSRRMLQLVLDNIPQGVFWKDRHSRYLGCNEVSAWFFGLENAEALKGKTDADLGSATPEQAESFMRIDREVMESNRPRLGIVEPARRADGSTRWLETSKVPIHDQSGRVIGVLGTWQDITERKRAEEVLREREQRLRLTVRSANVGLWDWDLATNAVVFSPEWKSQIGYAADEIPDHFEAWQSHLHPDDLEPAVQRLRAFVANPQGRYAGEFRLRHKDGSYRWIYTEGDVTRDAAGQPMHMLGCHIDITGRKLAAEALREAATLNQGILSSLNSHIAVLDKGGTITAVNEAWIRFARENGDSSLVRSGVGTNYLDVCREAAGTSKADGEKALEGIQSVLNGTSPDFGMDYPCHSPREERWFQMSVTPLSAGGRGAVVSHLDITERKQTGEALRRSEALLRSITDHTDDIIAVKDQDGRYLFMNPAGCSATGCSPEEFIGRTDLEFHPDRERALRVMADDRRVMESGQSEMIEEQFATSGGEQRFLLTNKMPRLDEQGRVIGVIIVSRDITEIRRSGQALRESEQQLQTLVENLDEGLIVADLEGRMISWNRAGLKMHGFASIAECRSRVSEFADLFELSTPDGALVPQEQWPMRRVIRGEVMRDLELRVRHLDTGVERIFSYGGTSVRDNSGQTLAFVTVTDITERKRAEELLERTAAERTAAAAALETEIAERRRLESEILEVSEREQRRLGLELHDDLAQQLTGCAMFAFGLQADLQAGSHPCADGAGHLLAGVKRALTTARHLAKSFFPVELENGGLIAALKVLAHRTEVLSQVRCKVEADAGFWIEKDSAIHLYRIVQESVANAIKHAQAKKITIECRVHDGARMVRVSDDGVGFKAPGKTDTWAGMGLHLFQYRARLIGAVVEVKAGRGGRGCQVTCRLGPAPPGL